MSHELKKRPALEVILQNLAEQHMLIVSSVREQEQLPASFCSNRLFGLSRSWPVFWVLVKVLIEMKIPKTGRQRVAECLRGFDQDICLHPENREAFQRFIEELLHET